MITAQPRDTRYQPWISNGEHQTLADTPADKGGSNSGFRPHDLLEAALESCLVRSRLSRGLGFRLNPRFSLMPQ